jgi:hypothetical protein
MLSPETVQRDLRNAARLLLTALTLGAALTGCVIAPAQPYYEDGGYYSGGLVPVAPPPPQAEYVGVPPVAGYIWIGGFWNWIGGRHAWVPGRWAAPRPGHRWTPHRWSPVGNGWQFAPGRWERDHR